MGGVARYVSFLPQARVKTRAWWRRLAFLVCNHSSQYQSCCRGPMAYQVIEAVEFKSETFPKSSLGGATFQQQYSTQEPTQLKQGTQTAGSFYEVILVSLNFEITYMHTCSRVLSSVVPA